MHTENRFNLIDEPWIPIVDVGRVSLKQIFSESTYCALGGNPVQKIALIKLLLAIAQSAYTPKDDDDWVALGADGLAQKCLGYLEKWHERFWLYGERPFLQMPEINKAAVQNFGAVLPEVATGNTTILTEKQIERNLIKADQALLLISLMGFSLGGKKTDNSVVLSIDYSDKSNEKGKPSTGKPGPSIGFMGFMHNFLLGESILQTLWFNLFTTEELREISFYPLGVGIAPWEEMPKSECCNTAEKLKKSLMGRLIPLSRFCLLDKEGLHYSEGIAHPGYKKGVVDTSIAVNFSGKDPKVIWVDPEKRPWRYITALLSCISNNNQDNFSCTNIKYGLNRISRQVNKFSVWSGGLRVSSNAGEQYVSGSDDFIESTIMLYTKWLGETWYAQLQIEMSKLDNLSKIIYGATINYFKSQQTDGKEQAKLAANLYWQLCERKFQSLVDTCGEEEKQTRDKKLDRIHQNFANCIYKSYDTFCQKETARQLDAWAKNRPNLGKYLKNED